MNGKTHKIFAPIFTFGTSYLLTQAGVLNHGGDTIVTVLLATLSSNLTAMAPDADLHSYKPRYVIWDKKPRYKVGGKYHVRLKGGRVAEYTVPKDANTKLWATLFKKLGVRKHRDWRSHSPSLWIPISYITYMLSVFITKPLPTEELRMLVPSIIAGMGLGYISHIVADASNKGGIPLFFTNKQTSITRKMFGKNLSNFFKSGNKIYNYLFIFAGFELVLFIFAPDLVKGFNSLLFGSIYKLSKTLLTALFQLLKGVFSITKGIIGS